MEKFVLVTVLKKKGVAGMVFKGTWKQQFLIRLWDFLFH